MKKAIWSSLPARQEDVDRVLNIIGHDPIPQAELIKRSLLSKTRCLCAIDKLLADGAIVEVQKNTYQIAPDEA